MTRHSIRAGLWPCVAVLASCVATIDETEREPRLDLPANWTAADSAWSDAPSNEWWREDLGDPTLALLIDKAFANNRDLAAASARLAAAAGERRLATGERLPDVTLDFTPSRRRQNFIGFPIPGAGSDSVLSTTVTQFQLGLDLSWEIDLWGRLHAGELRATRSLEAAAADFRGARISLAAQTALAWFAVVEARAQLALAEQTSESFASSAQRIQNRFERGVLNALDVRLANAERETAGSQLESRRVAVERATRGLQILIGDYPNGVVIEGAELPPVAAAVPAGIPADILSRRPDLVAAERRLAAADASLAATRADLYPRISLTTGGGTASNEIEDLVDGDFRVWSLAGNLLAPIFDGGRRRARVEIEDARRMEAYASWAGSVLVALSEVESALAAERHLRAQLERLEAASREATLAHDLSRDRYGRGLIDIITLLTAQRRDFEARSQVLALRRQRLDVRIELLLALGGGFREQENQVQEQESRP